MVLIIYKGPPSPCRVSVKGINFNRWKDGEEKEVSDRVAELLLRNKKFTIVGVNPLKKEEPKEEKVEKKLENMSKDELLDLTALRGIDADYSMTKKEIRRAIEESEV